MQLDPFDEAPLHREIVPHSAVYGEIFLQLRAHVQSSLQHVELIHIGSTAIADLRGKPMLDFVAITNRADLRAEQKEFERIGFHRRNVWVDRDDKPYMCASVKQDERTFNINIHICHRNDPVHRESIAFMQILNRRPDLRRKYEAAKDRAHLADPVNPEIYNREKEAVIRQIQEQIG